MPADFTTKLLTLFICIAKYNPDKSISDVLNMLYPGYQSNGISPDNDIFIIIDKIWIFNKSIECTYKYIYERFFKF